MAHFAFIAPPLPGHFNPLLALARELTIRGHRATFVNQPDAARLVTGHDLAFQPIGGGSHPPGSLDKRIRAMAKLNGPFGLRGMIAEVARFTDMICREAPSALAEIGADAVIGDQMEAAAGLVAEHLRLPFITVATALPINREPGIPPPYVNWSYDPSERGRWWTEGGYRISDFLMRGVGDLIEAHSRALGLPPRRRAEDYVSPLAQLAQAVRAIDFPRNCLPETFHYLGPFRHDDEKALELPQEDGRPLVFCSLGTLQGSRAWIFSKVARACAELDLRLVIAHGGGLSDEEIRTLPGEPMVFDYVPQRTLLRRTNLAITHAGFNTVLDALSFGVPMVAMPLAFEQPATGARLARAGVARVVSPRTSARQLTHEIAEVLQDSSYRTRADEVAKEIASAGGVRRAADLILDCLAAPSAGEPRAASTTGGSAPDDARGDSRSGSR